MNEITDGIQRRTFLAAGAAVSSVALAGSASAAVAKTALKVGDSIGAGWTIGEIDSHHAGAVIVRLVASDGGSLRVLVTRTDRQSPALATTGTVDLVLINAGEGKRPTPSDHVHAVERLAARLDGAETKLPGASGLLTATDRQARFRPIDH